MQKYAKIENQEKGLVSVGIGTNTEFYQSIGMSLMDVEQGYDGLWYLKNRVPTEPVEEARKEKLEELEREHRLAETNAHVMSSLGFEIDADDRANRDISGLLVTTTDEETSIQFCDFHNQMHEIHKKDLEVMQTEIIQNAQNLYNQKWTYRSQIQSAKSADEVNQIEIEFNYLNFKE